MLIVIYDRHIFTVHATYLYWKESKSFNDKKHSPHPKEVYVDFLISINKYQQGFAYDNDYSSIIDAYF